MPGKRWLWKIRSWGSTKRTPGLFEQKLSMRRCVASITAMLGMRVVKTPRPGIWQVAGLPQALVQRYRPLHQPEFPESMVWAL